MFLEPDDEIRGQKFICLSFLSPEKVLKNKDMFFISKFLNFFALDYKVKATESFIMEELRTLQNALADVQLELENIPVPKQAAAVAVDVSAAAVDVSGSSVDIGKTLKDMSAKLMKFRGALSQKTSANLDEHVKKNMTDFRESTILDAYERYLVVNRQKLEDEFHKDNNFRTTVRGLKCRGTYSTHEQATARAQQLHKKDPYFSVYVAEVGQWLPWDPEPDDIADQQYGNEQLNTLMKSYRENAEKRDEFFEEEKRQRIAEATAASKKEKATASFGPKGEEQPAAEIARDIFDGAADLALQRKMESENTIQHT